MDTLVWDKTAGCWLAQGTHQHAEQLRDRVADRQLHDGNSVRDLLVQPALQASSAFTLRRGMYVAPATPAPSRWPRRDRPGRAGQLPAARGQRGRWAGLGHAGGC